MAFYIIKYIIVLIIISCLTMYIGNREIEFQMLINLMLMVKMIEMEKYQLLLPQNRFSSIIQVHI